MENLKISLLQLNLIWEDSNENLKAIGKQLPFIRKDTDIVVLPEMFNTGFSMHSERLAQTMEGEVMEILKVWAKQYDFAFIGSFICEEESHFYNRLVFVEPSGKIQYYDKRHLFRMANENDYFKGGETRLIVNYKGWNILPMVCYDLRFPIWSRNTEDFDILLYAANWPTPRINAWDALLKARAIENMAYCIGVNRVGADGLGHNYPGHSSLYDPLGELISLSKKEEVLIVDVVKNEIDLLRNKLPFLNDRDRFSLLD